MKLLSVALAAALLCLSGLAAAHGPKERYERYDERYDQRRDVDYAEVLDAQPLYRASPQPVSYRDCRDVIVEPQRNAFDGERTGRLIVGGILGGVIGHQFGGGRGQDIATAAGAVIGSQLAAQAPGNRYTGSRYASDCRSVYETRYDAAPDGYDVTYRYRGRIYHAWMPYDPGRRLAVDVNVQPARYPTRY